MSRAVISSRSRLHVLIAIVCFSSCGGEQGPSPQVDILITNARIIDGVGGILEPASLAITNDRISSVSSVRPDAEAALEIDAGGLTVMPGLIDTHRHLFPRPEVESDESLDRWTREILPAVLRDFLESGITTIMSNGDYLAILDVRELLETGELEGPRLFATGQAFTAPDDWPLPLYRHSSWSRARAMIETDDPETARANVRELADAGVDAIKVVLDRRMMPDALLSDDVLAAIIDEGHAHRLPVIVHAVTIDDMLNAVSHGADRLVHTPHTGGAIADTRGARLLRDEGIPISTTVSFSSAEWAKSRGQERSAEEQARHAQMLENIRHLWDEGVTVAFGTDSPRGLDFLAEVRALSTVLSPEEIINALTSNAAAYLDISADIGTLEAGKIADVLIVNGDPLSDISHLSNVEVVIKGGNVVVDNRR